MWASILMSSALVLQLVQSAEASSFGKAPSVITGTLWHAFKRLGEAVPRNSSESHIYDTLCAGSTSSNSWWQPWPPCLHWWGALQSCFLSGFCSPGQNSMKNAAVLISQIVLLSMRFFLNLCSTGLYLLLLKQSGNTLKALLFSKRSVNNLSNDFRGNFWCGSGHKMEGCKGLS